MVSITSSIGLSGELVKAVLFIGFFALCAAAIYWNEVEREYRVYIRVFLLVIIIAGTTGVYSWPIFNWHLYPNQEDTSLTFYEQRVVTEGGEELKYDARAVKPALATPLKRDAKGFATSYSAEQQRTYGCFLLREANEHLAERKAHSGLSPSAFRFPPHQFGYEWSAEDIDSTERFVEIRTYRVNATVNEAGTEVISMHRDLQVNIGREQCS